MRVLASFFFFNDTATTEIYTLSLHDALPIFRLSGGSAAPPSKASQYSRSPMTVRPASIDWASHGKLYVPDRKSTRLNSSHANISYAVFCLKKQKTLFSSDRMSPLLHSSHNHF